MPAWQMTVKAQVSEDVPPEDPVETSLAAGNAAVVAALQTLADAGYEVHLRTQFVDSEGQTVETESDLVPTPPGP